MKEQPHICTVWASIRRAARAVASGQPDGHLPEVRHDGGTGGHARRETPQERTRRAVYATGNRWAIENFEATHH